MAPGARTSFAVVLVFHPEGCVAAGTLSTRPWPRIEVTSWHRSAWHGTSEAFRVHHAGRTRGCSG